MYTHMYILRARDIWHRDLNLDARVAVDLVLLEALLEYIHIKLHVCI